MLKAASITGSILAIIALVIVLLKALIALVGFVGFALKAVIVLAFILVFATVGFMVLRSWQANRNTSA
jgi:hypothetical protein